MSPGTQQGSLGPRRHIGISEWKWLAVSLVLIFVQACQPTTSTVISTELGVLNPPTVAVTSTPTLALTATPSQTPTPAFTGTTSPEPISTNIPEPSATILPTVVFAAIGDYGSGDQNEAQVAELVLSWQPDFIITLGDNNYPSGAADTMDAAVGQYFHGYIYPYQGSYGVGAEENRFFPTLGNHDLISEHGKPYFDYFTLPGNERYYDFTWGPLHFFALNDLDSEPDGVGASSQQAAWLKAALEASTSTWNIVYMHYPPYSSGTHGSTDWARWSYAAWGADVVLAGHDHTYERLDENGLPYIVNGLGGMGRYDFADILDGSLVRYNADYGAMRVEATESYLLLQFINRNFELIDEVALHR